MKTLVVRLLLATAAGIVVGGTLPLMAQHGPKHASPGSHSMHAVMMRDAKKMMEGKMAMTGNVDKDFARMMAGHHKSGVEMANAYLAHGKNRELRRLAQNLVRDQKKEIKILEKHD